MAEQLFGLMNNFQRQLAMLIFIAVAICFCYQVDYDGVDFGVSRLKDVVWNFIGLALTAA